MRLIQTNTRVIIRIVIDGYKDKDYSAYQNVCMIIIKKQWCTTQIHTNSIWMTQYNKNSKMKTWKSG